MTFHLKLRSNVGALVALVLAVVISTPEGSPRQLDIQSDGLATGESDVLRVAASFPELQFRLHETDRHRLTVTNWGYFGDYNGQLFLPDSTPVPRFEAPPLSNINYLYDAGLWLGGIVNGDTLVSTGTINYGERHEFYPEYGPSAAPMFSDLYGDVEYTSVFTDTLSDPAIVPGDPIDGPHRPLGIKVQQTTRSFEDPDYSGLLMMEFTVTNVGTNTIGDFWFGFKVDADIDHPDVLYSWLGDYTGFRSVFAEVDGVPQLISGQWAIDNDGDPDTLSGVFDEKSPLGAMGFAYLGGSLPAPSISSNWWIPSFDPAIDWGPQLLPGRRNETGGFGRPEGDAHKYSYLSNHEIDYPQYETALDKTAGGWIAPPDSQYAYGIADGSDTRFLYSIGSVDLPPGSSATYRFAWTIADSVHRDPTLYDSTFDANDPSAYAAGLDFSDWTTQLGRAANLINGNYTLAKVGPPRNPHIAVWDNSSALVAWDAKSTQRLASFEVFRSTDSMTFPASPVGVVDREETQFQDAGLIQNRIYYYAVRSIDSLGRPGPLSESFSVNTDRPPTPFGLATTRGNGKLTLRWMPSSDPDVVSHRIYRSSPTESELLIDETTSATTYSDNSVTNGALYTYRISAVSALGTESFFSEETVALVLAFDGGPLLLDGNLSDPSGLTDRDSVRAVWERILPGPVTHIEDDPGEAQLFALSDFNHHPITIILSSGRFAPREALFEGLRHYINAGGAVILIGRDLFNFEALTEGNLVFDAGHPAYDLFGLTHAAYPRVLLSNPTRFNAEFARALPSAAVSTWPMLTVDPSRTAWGTNPALPHPGAAIPFVGTVEVDTSKATAIYTFESTSPASSSLQGGPVGVISKVPERRCALLTFPLSYIDEAEAEDVLNRLILELGWAPDMAGDVNGDRSVNLLDIVTTIDGLFRGGHLPSTRNADVNADCVFDLIDVVYLINYIFRAGPNPALGCAG